MQIKKPQFKKEDLQRIQKSLPLILARHFTSIFLVGAVLALLIGVYYFYQNVFVLAEEDYDIFVPTREVNSKLFEEALEFIEDQESTGLNASFQDPFTP